MLCFKFFSIASSTSTLQFKNMTKNYTFCLYFSKSIFCLLIVNDNFGEEVQGTRKVERRGVRGTGKVEGKGSAEPERLTDEGPEVPEKLRGEGVRGTRKVDRRQARSTRKVERGPRYQKH
jgi:hypothetical protein